MSTYPPSIHHSTEERLLFEAESYGAVVQHNNKIVAFPVTIRSYAAVRYICSLLRSQGWMIQIGLIK